MNPRDEEVAKYAEEIRQRKAKAMDDLLKVQMRNLSQHWENIMVAHDKTDAATALREAGYNREFYMESLQHMADVRDESTRALRELAVFLVEDLNVAATTVGHTAGVAGTTVQRWIDQERGEDAS